MKVLTLGPEGTYSHRAARSVADDGDVDFAEAVTGIVEGVATGEYERGVVPIENSTEGSVTESLDALAERNVAILREIVIPIQHALIAQRGEFDLVASHAQALAQCRDFLNREYPQVDMESVASTSQGVQRAREDPSVAAIAHPDNASGSHSDGNRASSDDAGADLQVLAEGIQDSNSNATRFVVLAPESHKQEAGRKTTLIVYPNTNYPGLLLELLEPFAERDINLSRVESRPSGERMGDYVFHVDVESGLYEQRTKEALAEIEDLASNGWVRTLGSYDTEHVL